MSEPPFSNREKSDYYVFKKFSWESLNKKEIFEKHTKEDPMKEEWRFMNIHCLNILLTLTIRKITKPNQSFFPEPLPEALKTSSMPLRSIRNKFQMYKRLKPGKKICRWRREQILPVALAEVKGNKKMSLPREVSLAYPWQILSKMGLLQFQSFSGATHENKINNRIKSGFSNTSYTNRKDQRFLPPL